jgi:hypothetical protein
VIEERREGERRCVWLGGTVTYEPEGSRFRLIYDGSEKEYILNLSELQAKWVQQLIVTSTPQSSSQEYPHIHQVGSQFPGTISDFNAFLNTSSWKKIRSVGLVLV